MPSPQSHASCPLYSDPMANITAKFEEFSVLQHKKKTGSQQKQEREAQSNNTDCHLQGLCCREDASFAFHSTSHTKHNRLKPCGKPLSCQLFPVCLICNPLSKLRTGHLIPIQRKELSPACSQNHAVTKQSPVWAPF